MGVGAATALELYSRIIIINFRKLTSESKEPGLKEPCQVVLKIHVT